MGRRPSPLPLLAASAHGQESHPRRTAGCVLLEDGRMLFHDDLDFAVSVIANRLDEEPARPEAAGYRPTPSVRRRTRALLPLC